MRKIRIYPDAQLSKLWWQWISACRYVYNQAIALLKAGEKFKSSRDIRDRVMNCELPDWVKSSPCHIRQNAIMDAFDAWCQALKNGGEAKFKSSRSPSHCLKFNPGNYTKGKWYPSKCKGLTYQASESIPQECLFSTQIVKVRGQWYAIFPEVVETTSTTQTGVIALDPGVRSFLTGYDGEKIIEIGSKDIGRIYRLCQHLDDLIGRLDPNRKDRRVTAKQRKRMRQAATRMRIKIRNLIDEVHKKTACYLTGNYKLIFLPSFEVSDMVVKAKRKIRKKSVRQMMNWSHYRFKQHLKQLAAKKGVIVVDTNEAYTSKTCTHCGHVHRKLGGAKIFKCPNCGLEIDRDWGGARNNMLRALLDTTFSVSHDGIAIAVSSDVQICSA